MSCNLRIVGACAALSLSRLAASGLETAPIIAVPGHAQPSVLAQVVFAPPAIAASVRAKDSTLGGFALAGTLAERGKLSDAAIRKNPFLPRDESRETGTAESAVATDTPSAAAATSAEASPSVSFARPEYEAPAPALGPRHVTKAARETIAACLVLEAASQGDFGMRAVMAVIRNRAGGLPERFAPTVLQPKQFSALNKVTAGRESLWSAINRAQRDRVWPVALAIVDEALRETWHDPTGGATHYTRSAETTRWTRRLAKTTTIGAHSFYR